MNDQETAARTGTAPTKRAWRQWGGTWLAKASQSFYRTRYVVYDNRDGLANRLRLHALAHAYALRTGRRLVVNWLRNAACWAAYDDLFEPAFPTPHDLPALEQWLLRRALWHPHQRDCYEFTPEAWPAGSRVDTLPHVPARAVRFAPDFDQAVRGVRYLSAYRAPIVAGLTPRPEIRARFEAEDRRWPRPLIGLHLRFGDFGAGRVPLERALRLARTIRQRRPEATLLLVSDGTPAEVEPLLSQIPMVVRTKVNERTSLAGMQDAVIDLLQLAACDVVIGTPGSSFSFFAAFYGDRPYIAASEHDWQAPLDRALSHLGSGLTFGDFVA